MQNNRYLVVLNGRVVSVVEGVDFDSAGYTGTFLEDYDTVVQDNEAKLHVGGEYVFEAFAPPRPTFSTANVFENIFPTPAGGAIPAAYFE